MLRPLSLRCGVEAPAMSWWGSSRRLTEPFCPVDAAPGDQGQEEEHEASVRPGGAAAPEHDGEDVRDLEQQSRQRPVRVLRKRPEQPTAADVQEHELSGRNWCRACVPVQMPTWGDLGLRRVFSGDS